MRRRSEAARRARRAAAGLLLVTVAALPIGPACAGPIFDSHLHYSAEDAAEFTPEVVVDILERNGIGRAVVSGTPNAGTEALYRAAPGRIVPFASLYRRPEDKQSWSGDPSVVAHLESSLRTGIYRGVGEFHLFARDRASPVFHRVVELAAARELILHIHGDPEVIDAAFARAPGATIVWAHLGTRPEPPLLRRYLRRYPGPYLDTSVRDTRIAPDGELSPAWRALFMDYPERIVVGVDTFSPNRWRRFDQVAAEIRSWLAQLPPSIGRRLAWENAARLFGQDMTGDAQPAASISTR